MAFRAKQTFINLPVKDLKATVAFFSAIGFEFDPHYTDENATSMIIGENQYAMLLVEPFFQSFIKKELADASRTAEVIVAIAVDSREKVDDTVAKALEAGAQPTMDPADHGFMYSRSFQDIDGHLWEVFHMDPTAVPEDQQRAATGQ